LGDVLDGNRDTFDVTAIVGELHGADDHEALASVVGMQAHGTAGQTREVAHALRNGALTFATRPAAKHVAAAAADHFLGGHAEQALRGLVHAGDGEVLVVEKESVGDLIEDGFEDIRALPPGIQNCHASSQLYWIATS